MKFGHFDDERREYVIDTPKTPLPWINYLGSEDFFSLISNTAGGVSPHGAAGRMAAGGRQKIRITFSVGI